MSVAAVSIICIVCVVLVGLLVAMKDSPPPSDRPWFATENSDQQTGLPLVLKDDWPQNAPQRADR